VDGDGNPRSATVGLAGTRRLIKTDQEGAFAITDVPPGPQRLIFSNGSKPVVLSVRVAPGDTVEMDDVILNGTAAKPAPVAAAESPPSPPQPPDVEQIAKTLEAGEAPSADQLGKLLEAAGVSPTDWETFRRTGTLPTVNGKPLDPKELLKSANALGEVMNRSDAEAILAAMAGMPADALHDWLKKAMPEISPEALDSVSPATLAQALKLWVKNGGKLSDHVLAAQELGLVQGAVPMLADGTIVLYDARSGRLPVEEGWWYLTDPLRPSAQESISAQLCVLNSAPERTEKAGYFTEDPVGGELLRHPRLPLLDTAEGFDLIFRARVHDERHVREDRAGFSVIVIGGNLDGIELGFWDDAIWAQSDAGDPIFQDSHAETARFNCAKQVVEYRLSIQGGEYELYADEESVLHGKLRNYTRYGGYPYTTPNFIFLGDNTTSASGWLELSYVAVDVGAPTADGMVAVVGGAGKEGEKLRYVGGSGDETEVEVIPGGGGGGGGSSGGSNEEPDSPVRRRKARRLVTVQEVAHPFSSLSTGNHPSKSCQNENPHATSP